MPGECGCGATFHASSFGSALGARSFSAVLWVLGHRFAGQRLGYTAEARPLQYPTSDVLECFGPNRWVLQPPFLTQRRRVCAHLVTRPPAGGAVCCHSQPAQRRLSVGGWVEKRARARLGGYLASATKSSPSNSASSSSEKKTARHSPMCTADRPSGRAAAGGARAGSEMHNGGTLFRQRAAAPSSPARGEGLRPGESNCVGSTLSHVLNADFFANFCDKMYMARS